MTTIEAIKLMGFSPYADFNLTDLKKRYRKLAMVNHPDHGGSSEAFQLINEANAIVQQYLREVAVFKMIEKASIERTAIISLDDMLRLYDGHKIKIADDYELTFGRLKANKIYIEVPVKISINGIQQEFDRYVLYRLDNKYDVFCEIVDSSLIDTRNIEVRVSNKKTVTEMTGNSLAIMYNISPAMRVTVHVYRVLPQEEN